MKNLKKLAAAALSVVLSAASFGCSTPAIGGNTRNALTIDGYEVPAGLFIYYTLQGYSEASAQVQQQKTDGSTPTPDDVKAAQIESSDATEWIQDKATEYCRDFVNVQREFDAINGELTADEKDEAKQMAEYYYNSDTRLKDNGVSLDTLELMVLNSYKQEAVFKHYYGFGSEKGCSEDELKDYFDDNFARVKYISISLLDAEGNKVTDDEQRTLRKKAEDYAKQINEKSSGLDKMLEVDAAQKDYDEYKESQTTTASDLAPSVETTTTAVTTSEEKTSSAETTTTTDLYANEQLIQKNTTTTKDESAIEVGTTTTTAEDPTTTDDYKFKEFLFNTIEKNKATVYDYSEDTIYVVIRGDLRERLTKEDLWSDDYITNLQKMRYTDDFVDFLKEKAEKLEIEKNKAAYRRYDPFKKLVLEANEK